MTNVMSCMRPASDAMPSNGPQKSLREFTEFTWQASPNLNETPVNTIVSVNKAAATPQPKPRDA